MRSTRAACFQTVSKETFSGVVLLLWDNDTDVKSAEERPAETKAAAFDLSSANQKETALQPGFYQRHAKPLILLLVVSSWHF